MYQYIARSGHATQLDWDNDNLGLATHSGTVLVQHSHIDLLDAKKKSLLITLINDWIDTGAKE